MFYSNIKYNNGREQLKTHTQLITSYLQRLGGFLTGVNYADICVFSNMDVFPMGKVFWLYLLVTWNFILEEIHFFDFTFYFTTGIASFYAFIVAYQSNLNAMGEETVASLLILRYDSEAYLQEC